MDTLARLDPWFDDGNIILAAEGKAFRVHRGVLSSFSGVFRDMFACPHSNTAETELIESCPVIHLHDTATDIQIILRALYGTHHMYSCCEKMPFSVFAAFLRLGKKYDLPHLYSKAEARVYPNTEPTSINLSFTSGDVELKAPSPDVCQGIIPTDPYNIQLMNLLREMELTAYLPVLMFQCALCSPAQPLVNGHKLADGSVCLLSPPNLRSYILVTDILKRFGIQLTKSLTSTRGACTRSTCASNLFQLWSHSMQQPFGLLWEHERQAWFCAFCQTSVKSMHDAAVRKAWEELPTAFDFASWKEVKKVAKYGKVPVCHRALCEEKRWRL